VVLAAGLTTGPYTNLLTGDTVRPASKGALLTLEVAAVLAAFPVGLLETAAPADGR
jgi:hypothetical protein